jgi:glycosyltransferase involved in cell wall biosynthesis
VRILVVSGIWPPDVGGPASHAPEAAAWLRDAGHEVRVVVTADEEPAREDYRVEWVPRSRLRHPRTVAAIVRAARDVDVVYTTGMLTRSAAGSRVARRPFVAKLTADPAFERARRRGLFAGSLAEFQQERSARTLPLRKTRAAVVRAAAQIVTPSAYLRDLAIGWGAAPERVAVLPNPAPPVAGLAPREELRARWELDRPTLVFAGRLTAQKSLDVAIEAARRAGVALVIAGDGPDRAGLERLGWARFVGPQPRRAVLELFRAADAAVLSSAWENFPHGVVEALAAGTPVIATAAGGVAEIVRDGQNGLLVDVGDAGALAETIERAFGDPPLLERLRAAAAPSVAEYAPDRVYGRLAEILVRAAAG